MLVCVCVELASSAVGGLADSELLNKTETLLLRIARTAAVCRIVPEHTVCVCVCEDGRPRTRLAHVRTYLTAETNFIFLETYARPMCARAQRLNIYWFEFGSTTRSRVPGAGAGVCAWYLYNSQCVVVVVRSSSTKQNLATSPPRTVIILAPHTHAHTLQQICDMRSKSVRERERSI